MEPLAGAALGFPASAAWKDAGVGGEGGRGLERREMEAEQREKVRKSQKCAAIDANVSISAEINRAAFNQICFKCENGVYLINFPSPPHTFG